MVLFLLFFALHFFFLKSVNFTNCSSRLASLTLTTQWFTRKFSSFSHPHLLLSPFFMSFFFNTQFTFETPRLLFLSLLWWYSEMYTSFCLQLFLYFSPCSLVSCHQSHSVYSYSLFSHDRAVFSFLSASLSPPLFISSFLNRFRLQIPCLLPLTFLWSLVAIDFFFFFRSSVLPFILPLFFVGSGYRLQTR